MSKFGIVEKRFEYKGHDCICIFTALGVRNGYVSVDDNKDFSEYDIECHCGLNFGASYLNKDYNPKDTSYIGFDCGHICDGHDFVTALKYGLINEKEYDNFIEMDRFSLTFLQPVRTLEYVENECKKIVDQLEEQK